MLSVLLYDAKIRGDIKWKQETYIKWTLQLGRKTPKCIILDETKRSNIRISKGYKTKKDEKQ